MRLGLPFPLLIINLPRSGDSEQLSQLLNSREEPSTSDEQAYSPAAALPRDGVLPAGQCYCRFDNDWSEWSLSDPACKASLYQRAIDPLSGLARVWLDDYYNYKAAAAGVLMPPYADQISAFLYSDCTPAPPCSCMDIKEGESYEACFSEIQIYAADAARTVPEDVLQDAVAEGSEHTSQIRSWIKDAFPLGSCDQYPGEPYTYVPLALSGRAWSAVWKQVLGQGPNARLMIMVQLLLASLCALAVMTSMLVIKKFV